MILLFILCGAISVASRSNISLQRLHTETPVVTSCLGKCHTFVTYRETIPILGGNVINIRTLGTYFKYSKISKILTLSHSSRCVPMLTPFPCIFHYQFCDRWFNKMRDRRVVYSSADPITADSMLLFKRLFYRGKRWGSRDL